MRKMLTLIALMLMVSISALAQIAAVPQLMQFQGRLTKPDGTPVPNGTYSVRFSLWNALTGGTEKWNQTLNVTVRNGTFAAQLNTSTGAADKFSNNLFLEIKVGTNAPLTPRQQLVSVAYAMKADSVKDGSITSASIANGTITAADLAAGTLNNLSWLLNGNANPPANSFLGTTTNHPLNLKVNNRRAMQYSYAQNTATAGSEFRSINVLGGSDLNTLRAGIVGATLSGGGFDSFTGTDFPNQVNDDFATISGGFGNVALGNAAVIGGGGNNTTSADKSTIAGGAGNKTQGGYSFIGGGSSNLATHSWTVVGGGRINGALANYVTVGGGQDNSAAGDFATIAGGDTNTANSVNVAIGGGFHNSASGPSAVIGGGETNVSSGSQSTVSGGQSNTASGQLSTVSGGYGNFATGLASTVAGGFRNFATATTSFAAGNNAKANHTGTFVWADSQTTDFFSTGPDAFIIRAAGGVGIGTNAPQGALHVKGFQGAFNLEGTTQHVYMQFFPRGFAAGRKAYIGFASAGTHDLTIANEDGGAVQVVGTFVNNSDARWKTNVTPLGDALDSILNLRGVSYDWRQDLPDQHFTEQRQIGFLAQEVEKVLPELVYTDMKGYKSVAYVNVVPVLVEAVKTLKTQKDAEIQSLKADNTAIKAENAELKSRLDALTTAVAELKNRR